MDHRDEFCEFSTVTDSAFDGSSLVTTCVVAYVSALPVFHHKLLDFLQVASYTYTSALWWAVRGVGCISPTGPIVLFDSVK